MKLTDNNLIDPFEELESYPGFGLDSECVYNPPDVKYDFHSLFKYAKEKGKEIKKLTPEEMMKFKID